METASGTPMNSGPASGGLGNILWMYSTLPANIASGPLSTLIALYILKLGGGVLEVAYAITLASAISIPSVFLWGFLTDLLNKRRFFVILSYLLTTILFFALFLSNSVIEVILIYASISFVSGAQASSLNLLVMETDTHDKWSKNFSFLQMISALGTTIGFVIAWIVTGLSDIGTLILILFGSSTLSVVLAAKLISEPNISAKRIRVSEGIHSFVHRLVVLPMLAISIPHPENIRNMFKFKGLESVRKHFFFVFYMISFIFFFSAALFNTEYPVGLKYVSSSNSFVFFVILFSMVLQTGMFYFYDTFTKEKNKNAVSAVFIELRGAAYVIIGIVFTLFAGIYFDAFNIIFYALASGIAYAIYYPTSYSIFFNMIGGTNKGSAIGIYTAVIGLGSLLGAISSGIIAIKYSFGITFIAAGLLLLGCGYAFRSLPKA